MKKSTVILAVALIFTLFTQAPQPVWPVSSNDFKTGTPDIKSISVLAFGDGGILFIGDSKGGAVFALDLEDNKSITSQEAVQAQDIESKFAALMGTDASQVLIHDMAVNPLSQNIYFAVSRSRANWNTSWSLPNDLGDATVLLKMMPSGQIDEVILSNVKFANAALPNPVDATKQHIWKKGVSLRADTITDIVYHDGKVYIAGLSNEEFASTMWQVDFPFSDKVTATTVEIFHGAHGEFETHAPIRTFLPYELNRQQQLLAAYLCTPLVTFPVSELEDGKHLKGRTVAEFGSGNYPLDMVLYQKDGQDRILIANSNLPFMIIDPKDVESYDGSITEEVEGYVAGVKYEIRSGTGLQQLDRLNDQYFVALQRSPAGKLDLMAYPVSRF